MREKSQLRGLSPPQARGGGGGALGFAECEGGMIFSRVQEILPLLLKTHVAPEYKLLN